METQEERKFVEYLRNENLKFTPERRYILQEVFKIHEHFEADDIVIGLRRSGNRVSRASVYRTLPLLVECGLLQEVHSIEKHSHYEHIFGHEHHDHLLCSSCGKTIEFSNDMIESLQNRICMEHGFKPVDHKLVITGICSECSEKQI